MAGLVQSNGLLSRFPAGLFASTIAGGAWREPEAPIGVLVPPEEDTARSDIPARPAYTDAQTRQLRRHVLWLRRSGRPFLAAGEWAFLGYLMRWAHPFTIEQGDRLMALVDRVDDQRRGRL